MTAYQIIYEDSIDRHGLVTTARARELGLAPNTLALLAHRGRLEHVGRGVYRLAVSLPFAGEIPAYALAVEQVGVNAVLWGESVLAMLGLLAASDPSRIHVGFPGRLRRRVSEGIVVHSLPENAVATEYEGVRAQTVADALLACRGFVMPDRLLGAAKKAREQGYLTAGEYVAARKAVAP